MAIFYCDVSHGSRKTGQSGAAKVDYIMRTGKYGRDPGEVIGACAGHLPRWAGGNPRVFFAAADEYERSNGRLFTQVMFAIPNELSDADSLLLAYHVAEAVTGNGAPYAVAVHRGGVEAPDGETADAAPQEADVVSAAAADEADLPPHNRHGHLMFSERIDDGLERTAREWFRRANKKEPALGGAAKDRTMNGGNWVPEVRHLCADYINYALERAGLPERVTCESHETRIARAEAAGDKETAERLRLNPPGIHLGPTAWAIEQGRPGRPGRPSWRGDLNRLIAAEGEELRGNVEALNAQLNQLDVREAAVTEKLEAARRVAAAQFGQREEALQGTSAGKEILHAVRAEMIGESAAPRSVVQLGEMLEVAEERFGAALDLREAGFRETSVGSRYLADAASVVVGQEGSPTLYQREAIITTAETRLGRELDAREASLQEGADGAQLLLEVRHEHAEEYDPAPKLAHREQLITAAEARLRARADAERAAQRDLDEREEALRSLSIGSELLAAAEQELLGEGKRSGMLAARAAVVGDAERRADEALEGREEALRSRSLGERDGEPTAPAIDGAWLYASKLAELEAGRRQRGGLLDRGGREQGLVWAEQQMDRLDALHEAEAPYPFFGDLSEPGPSRRPTEIEELLDYAEAQQCAAAACRQERVDALSGDERVFFEEKLGALDPRRGGTGTPRPTHVDAAVDYARARVVALDEEIDGRRAVIEQTPGDGHARLLAAGFGEASRQQKIAALSVMETDLAEDFARREKRVRSDVAGVEFLRRGRLEVLGDAGRQPETLPERGGVIVAAEAYQRHAVQRRRAEAERRETRHQSISDTPDGAARLGAAGWDEARTDGERDQVLAIVERGLAADFERREEALRRDETGEALLRRGRLEVLEADREAATLAERGRILERAEALRQEEERQRAEERRTRVARQETDVRATKKGPGWLREAAERVLQGADRALTLEERERIVEMVSGWIRKDLDRRQKELRSTTEGACFLDGAKRSIGAVTTLAAEEQFVEAAEKQHRQYQEVQARRRARQLELWRKPGGKDLYCAVLTGLDPQWRPGGKTAVKNLDVSLEVAESDDERLGLLRDVLADPAEAARYREALKACGETFTVPDIDAAVDAVLRERAAAEARRQAEEQQRRELDRREAQVRATSAGGQRLKKEQSRRFGATLTLEEKLSVVKTVEMEIRQELEAREVAIKAKAGGGALLRRVEGRRGAPRNLGEHEQKVEAVERVFRAADEAELKLPTTPDPERRGCRVPVVFDALLDAVPAEDDDPFVGDVVSVLRARYAQRALEGVADESSYDASAREASARRHFGSAVVDAMKWCVLKIREIILAACHKILGGRGEAGERVQASLAPAGAVRQTYQRAAESAAEEVAIDVNAFYKAAASGRDQVAALEQETARRQQVLAIAAGGMDRQAAPAAAEEESDDRLARLVGVYADAEQRSCYRAALGAEVTLERVDAALDAILTFVRRQEAIFDYPGNDQHPSGKALYTAGLKSLAPPDWRPGEDLPAGLPNQVLEDVESQLADRVQRAADAVEALVPTAKPYPNIKPDYRVPAVDDELLDLLVQEDDNAFFKATAAELRERYAQRARYDTPREERYTAADRSSSQQKYLGLSGVQARAQEKHRLHLREIISVACDATLGGDLGERLAQRRDLVQRVADAAEKKVSMARPEPHRPEYQVPVVFDQTLEYVVAASTNSVIQEAAAEVRVRYERRAGFDVPYEDSYGPDDRRRAEWSHLRARVEIKDARAGRLWLESGCSFSRPTREAIEASVLNDHRSSILEAFEIAYDEVVGRGELGARLQKHRERMEFAADSVERDLPTMKSPRGYPVPSISDAELAERRAIADPVQQELIDLVWNRMDSREHTSTPVEERYSAADRRRSEEDWLTESARKTLEDQGQELWQLSSTQWAAARERARKNHRSRIRDIFETARDQAPVPTSDELVKAITKGPDACRSYRDLFAKWDVGHVVPYVVRNAIDPRLLEAVLGEQAARWVPQIKEKYAGIRARYPDQFSAEVESVWAARYEHWRELVPEETVPPGGFGPETGGSGIGEGTGGSGPETPGGSGAGMPGERPIQPGGHSDARVPPPRSPEKPHTGWQRSRTGPHVSRKR